jgi:hypothetical protein
MSNGMRHGKGTLLYKNGDKYDGEFKTTNLMAKAPTVVKFIIILVNLEITLDMAQVLTYPSGDHYEGDWKDGKHGKGIYTWPDGNATRVIGKMTKNMAKASILGLMVNATRVIGKMTKTWQRHLYLA